MKTSAHNIRILSLLLLFILLHSISEAKQYFFQQIPSQNGLSSMVRCMEVSQEKGYVWIGTRSGIGRFDGYEQRRYLRGNVTHILEDEEHTIWVITEKGVFRYNEIEDNFILVRDKKQQSGNSQFSLPMGGRSNLRGKRKTIQIQL